MVTAVITEVGTWRNVGPNAGKVEGKTTSIAQSKFIEPTVAV